METVNEAPVVTTTGTQPVLVAERTVSTVHLKKALAPFKNFMSDIWMTMDGYMAGEISFLGIDSAHVSMCTSRITSIINAFGACHVEVIPLDGTKLVKAVASLNSKIEPNAWFQVGNDGSVVLKTNASTIPIPRATHPDNKERELLATFENVLKDKWTFHANFDDADMATLVASLKSCSKISDIVEFTRDGSTHGMRVHATDGTTTFALDVPSSNELGSPHGDAHGYYSLMFLSWLQTMPKSTRKNHAAIGVNLGIDIPALICYHNLDLDITCLLAPRIKCEDEDEDVNDSQDVDDIDAIDEP